ncbi:MAG: hypothetical protein ACTMIA_12065 [Vibrio sp.]
MIGFTWETSVGLILSLFIILLVSPAGVKKASEQVISAQVAYGGGYLAVCFLLLNTIAYIWLFNDSSMTLSVNKHFLNLWAGLVSSTFGAVYWIFLCLFFVRKVQTKAGWASLFLWPIFMFYQNYLPELYALVTSDSEILKPRDSKTDMIATSLASIAILVLSYLYWTKKERWKEL